MARPTGLTDGRLAAVRVVAGAIAADNTTLTDANYPIAAALDCRAFQTIWVGVEIAGGTAPTATIEVLARDADAADGLRWKRLLVGSDDGVTLASEASCLTPPLDGTSLDEVRVDGWSQVYLRVAAVTASVGTTSITILAMPGKPRLAPNRYA